MSIVAVAANPVRPLRLGADALERVDDVVGRQRLAVLELDALAQLDRVLLRVVGVTLSARPLVCSW